MDLEVSEGALPMGVIRQGNDLGDRFRFKQAQPRNAPVSPLGKLLTNGRLLSQIECRLIVMP